MRALLGSFKHLDGPAADLLAGSRTAAELAAAEGMALASAAVRAKVRLRACLMPARREHACMHACPSPSARRALTCAQQWRHHALCCITDAAAGPAACTIRRT